MITQESLLNPITTKAPAGYPSEEAHHTYIKAKRKLHLFNTL